MVAASLATVYYFPAIATVPFPDRPVQPQLVGGRGQRDGTSPYQLCMREGEGEGGGGGEREGGRGGEEEGVLNTVNI